MQKALLERCALTAFITVDCAAPFPGGAGGKVWIQTLQANDDVELVSLVALNPGAAQAAVDKFGLRDVALSTSVSVVAVASNAHAVVNVAVPAAHHPVNVEAMFRRVAGAA